MFLYETQQFVKFYLGLTHSSKVLKYFLVKLLQYMVLTHVCIQYCRVYGTIALDYIMPVTYDALTRIYKDLLIISNNHKHCYIVGTRGSI